MFSANAKSNFGAIIWLFIEFFGFSGKMVVLPMRISSGKYDLCYAKLDRAFSHS